MDNGYLARSGDLSFTGDMPTAWPTVSEILPLQPYAIIIIISRNIITVSAISIVIYGITNYYLGCLFTI